MLDNLDSSRIRHLLFKAKIPSGQILGIAGQIATLAKNDGLISDVPDFAYQTPVSKEIGDRILAVIWELILENVYTPGHGIQEPNLPHLRLTEHGKQCLEAGELTAHDPDDYLKRLKAACPKIDDITLLYVGEALDSFRVSRFLPAVVMIGVAAESMLLRLVSAVSGALDPLQRRQKFDQETNKKFAKTQHDEVMKRLNNPGTPLPTKLADVLSQHVDGIYDFIRRTRNEAGHPTGRRMERQETHALLLLFPTYCETVEKLIDWLKANKI